MVVAVRATPTRQSAYVGTNNVATATIAAQAGDLLVVFAGMDYTATTPQQMAAPTSSAGTLTRRDAGFTATSGDAQLGIWTQQITTTATVTVSQNNLTSDSGQHLHLYCLTGHDTTTPVIGATTTYQGTASSSQVAPSIAGAPVGGLMLSAFLDQYVSGNATTGKTGPGSMAYGNSPVADLTIMGSGSEAITVAGATGTRTATPVPSTARAYNAGSIVIAPAAAGGGGGGGTATIAEHASAPASMGLTGGGSMSSAQFSPPANSLLVAIAIGEFQSTTAEVSTTVTDSAGGTWTRLGHVAQTGSGLAGGCTDLWVRYLTAAATNLQVNVAFTNLQGGRTLTVKVLTGADPVQDGTVASIVAPSGATSRRVTITPSQVGSVIYGGDQTGANARTFAPLANTSTIFAHPNSTDGSTGDTWRMTDPTTATTAVTVGGDYTVGNAGTALAVEIVPATVASTPKDLPDEALTVTDALTATMTGKALTLTETVTATDALTATMTGNAPTLAETVTATDALTVVSKTLTLTETVAVTDDLTVARQITLPGESVTAVDALTVPTVRPVLPGESLVATDLLGVGGAPHSLADQASVTETFTANASLTLADTATVTDQLTAGVRITLAETVAVTDALTVRRNIAEHQASKWL